MPKTGKDPHLIRVGKELERRLRTAAGIVEIINFLRPFTYEHFRGRIWGYDCYFFNQKVVKEVVMGEFVSGKSFITIRLFCNTYLRTGLVEILLFLDCDPKVNGRRSGSKNFRRIFEIGNKDPFWEKTLSFFERCFREGYSLRKSLFGER
jgi:hypothetical protein